MILKTYKIIDNNFFSCFQLHDLTFLVVSFVTIHKLQLIQISNIESLYLGTFLVLQTFGFAKCLLETFTTISLLVSTFVSAEEFFVDSDSVPGQCLPADEEKS